MQPTREGASPRRYTTCVAAGDRTAASADCSASGVSNGGLARYWARGSDGKCRAPTKGPGGQALPKVLRAPVYGRDHRDFDMMDGLVSRCAPPATTANAPCVWRVRAWLAEVRSIKTAALKPVLGPGTGWRTLSSFSYMKTNGCVQGTSWFIEVRVQIIVRKPYVPKKAQRLAGSPWIDVSPEQNRLYFARDAVDALVANTFASMLQSHMVWSRL